MSRSHSKVVLENSRDESRAASLKLIGQDPNKIGGASLDLEEIKIELVDKNANNFKSEDPNLQGACDKESSNSIMDSYNDDDEVEDENRNPAMIQINHSSSVTRAGA